MAPAWDPQEGMHVRDILATLRRNVLLIGAMSVAVLGIGLMLTPRARPTYTASGAIQLLNLRRAVAIGLEDQGSDRIARLVDPLQSQIEVVKGRQVLGRAVDLSGLRLMPAGAGVPLSYLTDVRIAADAPPDAFQLTFSNEGVTLRSRAGETHAAYGQAIPISGTASISAGSAAPTLKLVGSFVVRARPPVDAVKLVIRARDEAIDQFAGGVRASPRKDTDIIDVAYVSADADFAQRAANGIIQASKEISIETAQEKARRRRDFLAEQLANTDARLADAQLALSTFRASNHVYSSRDKIISQEGAVSQLQVRISEMKANLRMLQAMLDEVQRSQGPAAATALRALASAPDIGSNPLVSQLYSQLQHYETTLDSLTNAVNGHTEGHPAVARLNQLIQITNTRLVDAAASYVRALDARIRTLEALRSQDAAQMQVLPRIEAEENRLSQQVESYRLMGDNLRTELQKAEMAEAIEAGQVEVVFQAPLPGLPYAASRRTRLAMFAMLGLIVGIAGAFAHESMNTAIRRREDVVGGLRLAELGVIPRQQVFAERKRRFLPALHREGRNGRGTIDLAGTGIDAEAFRRLRTSLVYTPPGRTAKKIVIASAAPQEGKSTAAFNLAVAFAQQGVRALLVDADLRQPTLHRLLRQTQDPGLTSLLDGRAHLQEAVRPTQVPGLNFLPSGTLAARSSELLGRPAMRDLLKTFEREFDVTIFDTAPLLVGAEALILAAEADGVLFMVRAGRTQRDAAEQALRQLESVGANVMGAVINDPDMQVSKYGRYYHYRSYSNAP